MAKKYKINKDVRQLIDKMSDVVKKNKKGDFRFKGLSKKDVRKIRTTCTHWTTRKGKLVATTIVDPDQPENWKCKICKKSFPIEPLDPDDYERAFAYTCALVNQMFFYSVKMGGDSDDTRILLKAKQLLPELGKIGKNMMKQLTKRKLEEEAKASAATQSQFANYSSTKYVF